MNFPLLAAATTPAAKTGFDMMSFLPIVIIFGVFWFFLIVPQKKQQKQRQTMLNSLKKGDKVITIGGLHGEISEFDDDDVKLKVGDKIELKFTRSSIAKVKD